MFINLTEPTRMSLGGPMGWDHLGDLLLGGPMGCLLEELAAEEDLEGAAPLVSVRHKEI